MNQALISETMALKNTVKEYGENYHAFVGSEKELKMVCENAGKKWLSGIKQSRLLFN